MNGEVFPSEWEDVTKDGSLRRMRIPGGWILHSSTKCFAGITAVSCSEALIEIRDKENQPYWKLGRK